MQSTLKRTQIQVPQSNTTYDRAAALEYAIHWARGRNPRYLNFDKLGGDCTNFVSQCLHAGCKTQNYTPVFGWYYNRADDRAPAWTGVQYLSNFLLGNTTSGPYASETALSKLEVGDIIQLGNHERFYHSLFVTAAGKTPSEILVATHSFDTLNRVLESYTYHRLRCLHIEGVRP